METHDEGRAIEKVATESDLKIGDIYWTDNQTQQHHILGLGIQDMQVVIIHQRVDGKPLLQVTDLNTFHQHFRPKR